MKKLIAAAAAAALLFGATAAAAPENNKIIAVMYHDITDNPFIYNNFRIAPELLEGDIKQFLDHGYTFLKAENVTEEYIKAQENDKFVCLTFDDGYTSFYTKIYPLLVKYNVPGSFYIITSRIGTYNHLTEQQIKELDGSGIVEIGTHTHYIHLNSTSFIRDLYDDPEKFPDAAADYDKSIEILEKLTGKKISSVAYPNGIYNYKLDEKLRSDNKIGVTISTDYGVMDETMLDRPLRRINRDIELTSEEFFNAAEAVKIKK